MIWTQRVTSFLISEFKQFKCLYCTVSPEFGNEQAVGAAIRKLVSKLRQKFPDECLNLQPLELETKIKSLQDEFREERRKVIAFLSSDSEDDIYKPALWCYYLLKFLSEDDPAFPSVSVMAHHGSQNEVYNFILL